MATVSMAASPPTYVKLRSLSRPSSAGIMRASGSSNGGALTCDGVKLTQGLGDLPKVVLASPHVSLRYTCLASWKIRIGKDLVFVRPDAVFNGQKPISGGIPHCFTQFGPGAMQQHGFARNRNWSVVDSESVEGKPVVTFELKDTTYSCSMWDFSFQALYKVILDASSLSTELTVKNTDKKAFSFGTALHEYFQAAITGAAVTGLKGCKTLNKDPDPKNPQEGVEESWSDAVLWNPHLQMEAFYKDFVCAENAKVINLIKQVPQK